MSAGGGIFHAIAQAVIVIKARYLRVTITFILHFMSQRITPIGIALVVLVPPSSPIRTTPVLGLLSSADVVTPDGIDPELQFRFIRGLHKGVQRIREPLAPRYPSGAELGALAVDEGAFLFTPPRRRQLRHG